MAEIGAPGSIQPLGPSGVVGRHALLQVRTQQFDRNVRNLDRRIVGTGRRKISPPRINDLADQQLDALTLARDRLLGPTGMRQINDVAAGVRMDGNKPRPVRL
jgi:hypothetical protein